MNKSDLLKKGSRLALITSVFENYDVLTDFFKSLEVQKNKSFHIFLADQSEEKKPIEKNSLPISILYSKNLGYAHAVNLGLEKAAEEGFSNFCIINNDTLFESDFVDKVLDSLRKNSGAIVGGKIYYAPGFEYHKKRYKKDDLGKVLWYAGGDVDWNHAFTIHRGVDEVDKGRYDTLKETEFITGTLICFDKKVFEALGFWDESYFLYFEDADFCERAKRKGVKLFYDPSIVIWHKVSQSTGGSGSPLHQRYQSLNRVKFGLKYAPLKTRLHLIKNYVFNRFKKI